ncbi:MAG: hypothetical protein GVY36_17325 [Verrucomicrobia bacterium]|jgi:hypothetical protein|nr:hypothetical protein [Verrucomicrobiota bacterium]
MGFFNNIKTRVKGLKPPNWGKLKDQLPAIQKALYTGTNSTLTGISGSLKGLYGRFFISNEELKDLAEDLEDQGARYRELLHGKLVKKDRLKDCFALGGEIYLLSNLPEHFPADIEAAYAGHFPRLAAEISLSEHIESLDPGSQMGFLSGLKGKLFEQKYVDYLNEGELPDGYTASLADSPVQAGWDIMITDAEGNIERVLQAKATSSLDYVQTALEKYPEIDVVSTDEVYSQLVMNGISEGLHNSGISNEAMIDYITTTTGLTGQSYGDMFAGLDLSDFYPPILTAGLIAFTSYRDPKLANFIEKTEAGGLRFGKAYFAYILGIGVTAVTHTWWLGLAAAVVSRATSDEGYRRFELMHKMRKAKRNNRTVVTRWAKSVKEGAFA